MDYKHICATWTPRVLSLLRIMAALFLFEHGTAKILGFPAVPVFAKLQVMSLFGASGIIELIGGALLAIGLFTRPVAFILSGLSASAYFIVHAPQSFYPIANGGELAALYCFVFFYLVFAGGGSWSLDALRKGSG
ncbi:MAG: DoxX family protein [Xanthobacteraceae bacterium]|nr:MAG: DoxX family protein [Xanthobacteraceae bacterium]